MLHPSWLPPSLDCSQWVRLSQRAISPILSPHKRTQSWYATASTFKATSRGTPPKSPRSTLTKSLLFFLIGKTFRDYADKPLYSTNLETLWSEIRSRSRSYSELVTSSGLVLLLHHRDRHQAHVSLHLPKRNLCWTRPLPTPRPLQ